ncbi:MAG: DUF1572 family protein [Bacteroidota bacterium]|nr:DUF1572 family protein [Bacteroidota bacterium]MDP4232333.1 DUF1572 family protein [Bacteroidota bacterium]MDP4241472.1 DUF1572 family protein [Bacteroidota bacterium]MDP4286704.1 DUF1572 family protein [Bacteroidota bacterium]
MKTNDILTLSLNRFEQLRSLGEKTLAQLGEDDIHWAPDPESNSIAIIVQHLHGNMLSRFTDFLTTDGEKPNRHRDEEFVEQHLSLADLKQLWGEGWDCVFTAIHPLTEIDLSREVFIRNELLTVLEAILRQLSHYAYHVGQMVYIGKHCKGNEWKTLSIPKPELR